MTTRLAEIEAEILQLNADGWDAGKQTRLTKLLNEKYHLRYPYGQPTSQFVVIDGARHPVFDGMS